jgi:Zn finger protein HypA/HybF involved in hydrogenase expression
MSSTPTDPGAARPHRTASATKPPPKLFECKLCGKVFDSDEEHPSCPECDSNDVEQVG